MRQWWHNRSWERKHRFPGHYLGLHSRTGIDVKTRPAVGHQGKVQGADRKLHITDSEGLLRLLQVKLWGLSTAQERSLCGRTSLQNWFLRWMKWKKQTAEDVVCACLYTPLLSMPSLQCQLSCGKWVYFNMRDQQEYHFLKAPRKCTLSLTDACANVSGGFNVHLALFQCFSVTKTKYFGKLHFAGGKKKVWDLGLFQFGVAPYAKFLEFPVGNTIFQPEGKTRLIGSRAWRSLCVTIFVLVILQTNWSFPGL